MRWRRSASCRAPWLRIPRFRTPAFAIWRSRRQLALALAGSFSANATFAAIVRLVYYALTCAALIVLRRRAGEAAGIPAARRPGVRRARHRLLRVAAHDAHFRTAVDSRRADRGGPAVLPFSPQIAGIYRMVMNIRLW
jgi:hypothetical protein